MPTLSVKLPDATKARIERVAIAKGTSPHAFMVEAIESKLDSEERRGAFVQAALQSRDNMIASGKAYDGDEFLAYARARVRGEKAVRPRLKSIKGMLKQPKSE
jgi:predicted transcriptional regulator